MWYLHIFVIGDTKTLEARNQVTWCIIIFRFVGYLEEQAVVTYSEILDKMDEGKLPMWSRLPAPEIAAKYWKLGDEAMMRDVILAIRLVDF